MTTPFPQVRAALELLRAPEALSLWRPDDVLEARLREGNALHTDAPPGSVAGRALGLILTMVGRTHGYPCIAGGSGELTRLLVERAVARGVELRLGSRVTRVPPARHAVIGAVAVWELAGLLGRQSRVRRDPATLKVDWTLDGPVPWIAEQARHSPVVHIGAPGRFVLFGQYSMADPSRAPAGKETAWAYSHDLDSAEAIEAAVEELAPGFGALVRGRREEWLEPGRLNGGTARLSNQLVFRPRFGRPRVAEGVYLASMSAHPGGGVHGAPGWIAARAAIRDASRRTGV